MLANDAEFFLYGGAIYSTQDDQQDPDSDTVLLYQAYAYGPDKPLWQRGFKETDLGDVSPYISYGAAVNAPSEQKAWYFSGMTSPSGEVIHYPAWPNGSDLAQNISNHLIEVDLSDQDSEKWTNRTLPSDIKGRANAEAVWVPVGEQGILVVLGGVTYPEWATQYAQSPDEDASVSVVFREHPDPANTKPGGGEPGVHEGHRYL